MAKTDQYLVVHSAVGGHPAGTLLGPDSEDTLNWDWERLEGRGAIRKATAADRKPADTEVGGGPQAEATAKAEKQPLVGPDAPALTTGQPGGAPLGSDPGGK